jgi:hypothetical protein
METPTGDSIMDWSDGAGIAIGAIALSAGWVSTLWLVLRHRYRMKRLEIDELRQELQDRLDESQAEMRSYGDAMAERIEEVSERVDLVERMLLRASRAEFSELRDARAIYLGR